MFQTAALCFWKEKKGVRWIERSHGSTVGQKCPDKTENASIQNVC